MSAELAARGPSAPRTPGAWFRAQRRRLRPIHYALLALALALFVAVSILLARFLSTENVERDDVLAVLVAQASGNANGVLAKLDGCRSMPACAATVRSNATRLRRAGSVKILSLTSHTAYSLSASHGTTRVAWTVIGRLPVVQCVQVTRTGDFLTGVSVTLSSISSPIPNEADC
ncbi:MAG: hypothetical protein ACTHM1_00580 [Solirubrobacteraceae bacterium]